MVSPFFRYTYAFFPPDFTPIMPVRAFLIFFARIGTIRTMSGVTLYTALIAADTCPLFALVEMLNT